MKLQLNLAWTILTYGRRATRRFSRNSVEEHLFRFGPMAEQVEARRLRNNRWDIDPGDEEIRQLVKRLERDLFDMLNPAPRL